MQAPETSHIPATAHAAEQRCWAASHSTSVRAPRNGSCCCRTITVLVLVTTSVASFLFNDGWFEADPIGITRLRNPLQSYESAGDDEDRTRYDAYGSTNQTTNAPSER